MCDGCMMQITKTVAGVRWHQPALSLSDWHHIMDCDGILDKHFQLCFSFQRLLVLLVLVMCINMDDKLWAPLNWGTVPAKTFRTLMSCIKVWYRSICPSETFFYKLWWKKYFIEIFLMFLSLRDTNCMYRVECIVSKLVNKETDLKV